MAAPNTDHDTGTMALWFLALAATIFFVVLLVFAIQSAQTTSSPEGEITPPAGEEGPEEGSDETG